MRHTSRASDAHLQENRVSLTCQQGGSPYFCTFLT
nr:MAG TPA: hypothetical protein [Caudoviricetes sp.]